MEDLARPRLAENLRSLSMRIGKPRLVPNPPSDKLFLIVIRFAIRL